VTVELPVQKLTYDIDVEVLGSILRNSVQYIACPYRAYWRIFDAVPGVTHAQAGVKSKKGFIKKKYMQFVRLGTVMPLDDLLKFVVDGSPIRRKDYATQSNLSKTWEPVKFFVW
jgi:hypothetical protein